MSTRPAHPQFDSTHQSYTTPAPLSRRSYGRLCVATSWEEIWEAGNYYDRVAELLEDARQSIVLVGWQIDSRLPMKRPQRGFGDPQRETLKQKIARLCETKPDLHVYILMWDHAWFYVYEREVWQGRIWENIHPRVHFVFDNRHPLGASHHEKLCLIDGRVALCGGIDLCDERWDTRAHLYHDRRRSLDRKKEHHGPYHDLAVQVSGPICLEIHRHIAERWDRISVIPFPKEPQFCPARPTPLRKDSGGHSVYFSRTLARIDLERGQPHLIREIEFLYRELIERAQKRLILEGQYYWSEEFNDLLIRKIQKMRGKDFEINLILADLRRVKSLTRVMSQYELRLLDKLVVAAKSAGVRLQLCMPYSYPLNDSENDVKSPARPVYVHSKTVIVDDQYLSIGSANFAARALRLDSEVNLTLEARTEAERRHIENFGNRLLAHWRTHSVDLRPINPALLLHHGRGSNRWFEPPSPNFTWIPWEKFFDPEISPLYPLKLWLYRWASDRNPWQRAIGKFALTAVSASLVLAISGIAPTMDGALRSFLYAFMLCSAWAIPMPFLPLALVSVIDLSQVARLTHADPGYALRIPILSLWMVSLLGYFAARMFPTRAGLLYQDLKTSPLAQRLGKRFFPLLLLAVFDPFIPLHYKIIYEGIYCMPLAWFALVNGLLLPSVLFGILSTWSWAWNQFAPQQAFEFVHEVALPWMLLMLLIAVARRSRVEIKNAKKAENSVLQHS